MPYYRDFCPAPGHQLGFNDIKTIEVKALIKALAGGPKFMPDFREAYEIQRVVDAIVHSATEKRWIEVAEVARRKLAVGNRQSKWSPLAIADCPSRRLQWTPSSSRPPTVSPRRSATVS